MEQVTICEVGLRDGLQNEKATITTADKIRLMDQLVGAGVTTCEVTSFVNPKAVPLMADAPEVMRHARTQYPSMKAMGLIFNEQGMERAIEADCQAVALVLIVPDGLSRANTKKTAPEWMAQYQTLIPAMKARGLWVRTYLAGAWISPYDGQTNPDEVLAYAEQLNQLGADELCLTDVIGQAHPQQVGTLVERLASVVDSAQIAVHLHDTQALGLANALSAMQAGCRIFDTSIGGLGGCPFAPGSAGNLATEDLVLMLDKMGYDTGIDCTKLWQTVFDFEAVIGRTIGGRSRAWYVGALEQV